MESAACQEKDLPSSTVLDLVTKFAYPSRDLIVDLMKKMSVLSKDQALTDADIVNIYTDKIHEQMKWAHNDTLSSGSLKLVRSELNECVPHVGNEEMKLVVISIVFAYVTDYHLQTGETTLPFRQDLHEWFTLNWKVEWEETQ